jgi:hypothetical protein
MRCLLGALKHHSRFVRGDSRRRPWLPLEPLLPLLPVHRVSASRAAARAINVLASRAALASAIVHTLPVTPAECGACDGCEGVGEGDGRPRQHAQHDDGAADEHVVAHTVLCLSPHSLPANVAIFSCCPCICRATSFRDHISSSTTQLASYYATCVILRNLRHITQLASYYATCIILRNVHHTTQLASYYATCVLLSFVFPLCKRKRNSRVFSELRAGAHRYPWKVPCDELHTHHGSELTEFRVET